LDQVSRGRTRELPAPGTDRSQLSRRAGLRRIAAAGVVANEKLHAPILNPSVSRRNEPIGSTSVQRPERWASPEARGRRMRATSGLAAVLIRESRRLRTRMPGSPPTRARSASEQWLGSQIAITLAAAALIVVAAFARSAVLTTAAGQDEMRARASARARSVPARLLDL
jgi:hypothetical protein